MKVSADCIALITHFEGCKLKAYKCPAGVWTIGYGHTGIDVTPTTEWTQEQADARLMKDLEMYEADVLRYVTVPLTQNQFDALVSFTYNLGASNLRKSTLLEMLNDGRYEGAADQFLLWVNRGSKFEKGLTRRRKAERLLFLDKEWNHYESDQS